MGKIVSRSPTTPLTQPDGGLISYGADLIDQYRRAAVHGLPAVAEVVPRSPIVGSFPNCCARAAGGHVAGPPSSGVEARRPAGLVGQRQCERAAKKAFWKTTQAMPLQSCQARSAAHSSFPPAAMVAGGRASGRNERRSDTRRRSELFI